MLFRENRKMGMTGECSGLSEKNTFIFKPKTQFPMRGHLANQEPSWLAWWNQFGLYAYRRKRHQNCPLYVIQDGPPYANGPIHMGHALNKILKDFVQRFHYAMGYDVSFIPGWDCHGLPIENQIEKTWGAKNQTKGSLCNFSQMGETKDEQWEKDAFGWVQNFRKECRDFAEMWIQNQRESFRRIGVLGDWENPYLTMDYAFESNIVKALFQLLKKSFLYRGLRPVWWSPSEKTALAEAEVEYKDKTSKAIYVTFPIAFLGSKTPVQCQEASVMIWTTTPWSLPGNKAVAYHPEGKYGLYEVISVKNTSLLQSGQKILLSSALLDSVSRIAGIEELAFLQDLSPQQFEGVFCWHPLRQQGFEEKIPLLAGDHVSESSGTGFVHTAPAHGMEDFFLAQKYQLDLANPLDESGIYRSEIPFVAGKSMESVYEEVLRAALLANKNLVVEEDYKHSYPHSWRSKKPVFYSLTPQWFIKLNDLRQSTLDQVETIQFYPKTSARRMESTLAQRPDWCISRQRLWGVPIPFFLHRQSGEILVDEKIFQAIEETISRQGCDFWFTHQAYDLLEKFGYNKALWVKNSDIVDVWFESGLVSPITLLHEIPKQAIGPRNFPADVYLEGSDQHRAWFQSSALLSQALYQDAPCKAIVTHGFLLDEKQEKMSKSLGNGKDPIEISNTQGADILRLWVAYSDYQKDIHFGPTILSHVQDIYRRLRNTLRYLLGSLDQWCEKEYREVQSMDLLQIWIHHRLRTLWGQWQDWAKQHQFQKILIHVHQFCNHDLSSVYFPMIKDGLYCGDVQDEMRCRIRSTLMNVCLSLVHFLAPFIPFTAEEAWHHFAKEILGLEETQNAIPLSQWEKLGRNLQSCTSLELPWPPSKQPEDMFWWTIHGQSLPKVPDSWRQDICENIMAIFFYIREGFNGLLERNRETMKDSLQAFFSLTFLGAFSEKTSHGGQNLLWNQDALECLIKQIDFESFLIASQGNVRRWNSRCQGRVSKDVAEVFPEIIKRFNLEIQDQIPYETIPIQTDLKSWSRQDHQSLMFLKDVEMEKEPWSFRHDQGVGILKFGEEFFSIHLRLQPAVGEKCSRCWKIFSSEVSEKSLENPSTYCRRCQGVS